MACSCVLSCNSLCCLCNLLSGWSVTMGECIHLSNEYGPEEAAGFMCHSNTAYEQKYGQHQDITHAFIIQQLQLTNSRELCNVMFVCYY
jgi:hypothetical protein